MCNSSDDLYIAEINIMTLPFYRWYMRLSSFTSTQQAPEKAIQVRWWVIYGRVGSFKITEISINPNPVCHFVVVFRCIYVHVFYHCRHITVYWSKIRVFGVFSYPTSKTTCTMLRLLVLTQYQRVTDRRTDGRTRRSWLNRATKPERWQMLLCAGCP